jgi:uncharacterized phage-like protein YoqJ
MAKYVIAVTGHRDIVITEALKEAVRHYLKDVTQKYDEVVLLSPLAVGADQLVAKVALEYDNIILEVPMPFHQERYLEIFDASSRENFLRLSQEAKHLFVIPKAYTHPYENLGRYMVEHSDVLLALWDGTINGKKGGTADVVGYAKPLKHLPVKRKNS